MLSMVRGKKVFASELAPFCSYHSVYLTIYFRIFIRQPGVLGPKMVNNKNNKPQKVKSASPLVPRWMSAKGCQGQSLGGRVTLFLIAKSSFYFICQTKAKDEFLEAASFSSDPRTELWAAAQETGGINLQVFCSFSPLRRHSWPWPL